MLATKRFLLFIGIMIKFLISCLLFSRLKRAKIEKYRMQLIHEIIDVLNIRIRQFGKIPDQSLTLLYMANHRSYIDPVVIMNYVQATPVVKKSVKYWPGIGWCISWCKCIWVKRSSPTSKTSTRVEVVKKIKENEAVLIFPEGTTHLFKHTIGFKRGLFKEAAQHNFSIAPISIDYFNPTDAWISNDNFIRHFFECFSKKETVVGIYFHEPVKSQNEYFLYDLVQQEVNYGMKYIQNYFQGMESPGEIEFLQILHQSRSTSPI